MAKAKKTGKSAPAKKAGAKAAAKKAANGKKANGAKDNGKTKANGKAAGAEVKASREATKKEPKVTQAELDALRKPVDEAKANLDKARTEAKALTDLSAVPGTAQAGKAHALVKETKEGYRGALGPYREACRKAGVECQFEVGRSANVSDSSTGLFRGHYGRGPHRKDAWGKRRQCHQPRRRVVRGPLTAMGHRSNAVKIQRRTMA